MANRDFNKIERIMKDFSLGVGEGGSSSNWIINYGKLEGKHINVEKLIAFLSKIGYDENTTLGELPGLIVGRGYYDSFLRWYPDECGGGEIKFQIDNMNGQTNVIDFSNKYEDDKAFETLREFKEEIESETYDNKLAAQELLFSVIFKKDNSYETTSFDDIDFFETTN